MWIKTPPKLLRYCVGWTQPRSTDLSQTVGLLVLSPYFSYGVAQLFSVEFFRSLCFPFPFLPELSSVSLGFRIGLFLSSLSDWFETVAPLSIRLLSRLLIRLLNHGNLVLAIPNCVLLIEQEGLKRLGWGEICDPTSPRPRRAGGGTANGICAPPHGGVRHLKFHVINLTSDWQMLLQKHALLSC